jgi:hypothetical protein
MRVSECERSLARSSRARSTPFSDRRPQRRNHAHVYVDRDPAVLARLGRPGQCARDALIERHVGVRARHVSRQMPIDSRPAGGRRMDTSRRTGETREGGAERLRHDVPRSAATVERAVTFGRSVGAVDL